MMYRPHTTAADARKPVLRRNPLRKLPALMLLGSAVGGVVLLSMGFGPSKGALTKPQAEAAVAQTEGLLSLSRIDRNCIPSINACRLDYRQHFNDLNDVQLDAAKYNGLAPEAMVQRPEDNPSLVHIASNSYYHVDTLYYSSPYLVPSAAILLQFVGERFSQVLSERFPKSQYTYRPVVTSALRSYADVLRLRRRNRNATENSCHCYGTTVDLSYIRFLRSDGTMVNELFLKEALAQALYELRYEGLCYVKYERRQACFHITLRNVEYKGMGSSHSVAVSSFKNTADGGMLPEAEAVASSPSEPKSSSAGQYIYY